MGPAAARAKHLGRARPGRKDRPRAPAHEGAGSGPGHGHRGGRRRAGAAMKFVKSPLLAHALSPWQARQLAQLLDLDVREINRKLASEKDFVFLKRQIAPDVAERVLSLGLPGIHEQREYRRYYPAGDVAAH